MIHRLKAKETDLLKKLQALRDILKSPMAYKEFSRARCQKDLPARSQKNRTQPNNQFYDSAALLVQNGVNYNVFFHQQD